MQALETEDYPTAVAQFEKAARQGNLESAYQLGLMYLEGRGVPQDPGKAIDYFEEAAEPWLVRDQHKLGFAEAQYQLGLIYGDGSGIAPDGEAAERWFRRAAEQGHSQAQFALGELLLGDPDAGVDPAQAFFWLRVARESLSGEDAARADGHLDGLRKKLNAEEVTRLERQVSVWSPTN
ncbi:MAG TPA: tetratricopeptide repeat protein [Burkholderiales bacterium]|nr:tetratricopeptide repeat protein [Burkholderiales bacterium]